MKRLSVLLFLCYWDYCATLVGNLYVRKQHGCDTSLVLWWRIEEGMQTHQRFSWIIVSPFVANNSGASERALQRTRFPCVSQCQTACADGHHHRPKNTQTQFALPKSTHLEQIVNQLRVIARPPRSHRARELLWEINVMKRLSVLLLIVFLRQKIRNKK